jgi:hypothetical protein
VHDGTVRTSQDDILEYEKALETEKSLEQIIETPVHVSERRAAKNSMLQEG